MKLANARDLRDPRALPAELRHLAARETSAEAKDILEHAADVLSRLQQQVDPGRRVPHHGSGP